MLLLCCALASATTVIVDDQDGSPGFTTTGDDWTTWGMSGHGYDGGDTSYHYLSHTLGGSDRRGTATWTPELPSAGVWRAETWFRRTENRTSEAEHLLYDRDGFVDEVTLDQRGEGASDWVVLGELSCEAGRGSCYVTLDGTDDDQSDEANAVRFVLVSEDLEEPPEEEGCSEEPGSHTIDLWAGSVSGSGWSSSSAAEGEADGVEAHSENVDAGELLTARGFGACSVGHVTAVELAVKARTQYESGSYELQLLLAAAGSDTVFTGTSSSWTTLSLGLTSWEEVQALEATVGLHDHPGGQRDSDAWVDAFRLRVSYTVEAEESEEQPEDTGTATFDTDSSEEEDEGDPGRERLPRDLSGLEEEGGCSTAPRGGGWLALLGLALLARRGSGGRSCRSSGRARAGRRRSSCTDR